jgi:hypothetical protein
MKMYGVLMVGVLSVMFCFFTPLFAQEQKPPETTATEHKVEEQKGVVSHDGVTGTAALSLLSGYIFRGYQLGKDSLVIQPYLSGSYKGFSASFWGNIDTHEKATQNFAPDRPGQKSFNEADLTLSYTYVLDKWSFTGGYIYYDTKYAAETEEFFGTVSYDWYGKPTFSVYRDFTAYPGWYLNFSLSHSFPVYKEITLDLGASFGYEIGDGSYWQTYQASTGAYTGSKYNAFHDGMVKAGLSIPVTKKFVIQPLVAYWFPLSNDAKKRIDGNSYNPSGYLKYLWQGGVNCTYNF